MVKNNTLLYGLPCVGKSFALASIFKMKDFMESPGKLVYLVTERNALRGFNAGLKHYKINIPENKLYTSIISADPKEKLFSKELAALKNFSLKSASEAQKDDPKSNMNKDKYDYFGRVVGGMEEIVAEEFVTKKSTKIGNIGANLNSDDIVVIDGLSPIVQSIWAQLKGDRVISAIQDYQTVQYWVKAITELWQRCPCSIILLAHADKGLDEVSGTTLTRISLDAGIKITASYGGFWDNVIYAYKDVTGQFYWAGAMKDVETAARDIPAKSKLTPDFSLPEYTFFKPFM